MWVRMRGGDGRCGQVTPPAWSSTSGTFGLAAYVTNLLDDQYVTGINNITTDTFGTPFAAISEPRMWGAEVTFSF